MRASRATRSARLRAFSSSVGLFPLLTLPLCGAQAHAPASRGASTSIGSTSRVRPYTVELYCDSFLNKLEKLHRKLPSQKTNKLYRLCLSGGE